MDGLDGGVYAAAGGFGEFLRAPGLNVGGADGVAGGGGERGDDAPAHRGVHGPIVFLQVRGDGGPDGVGVVEADGQEERAGVAGGGADDIQRGALGGGRGFAECKDCAGAGNGGAVAEFGLSQPKLGAQDGGVGVLAGGARVPKWVAGAASICRAKSWQAARSEPGGDKTRRWC